jgi:hypothetical protein
MRTLPRERGRQRRRNFRQLLLQCAVASVATLIAVQGALWRYGFKPTPVHVSSTLSSTNLPPAKTASNINIPTDIVLESNTKVASAAIQGNGPKQNKKEAEHHPVDITASFNEGKFIKRTSAEETNSTNSTTNILLITDASPKTSKRYDPRNITIIKKSPQLQQAGSSSTSPFICRTRNLVWDHLIVADDTAFRPKTIPTDGRTTNTFSRATTVSYSNGSTTASSSQAVTVPTVKLICFVMTHDGYHDTRVEAVRATWGSRCDSLIIASNATDTSMSTIAMNSEASYTGLWEKLNETMQYIYETYHPYRHSQNDNPSDTSKNNHDKTQQFYEEWIVKADDDSYFIIENLRAFLASHQVQALHNPAATATEYHRNDTSYEGKTKQKVNRKTSRGTPLIYGRIYSAPRYKHLANRSVYFRNPVNLDFKSRFYAKMKLLEPVLYVSRKRALCSTCSIPCQC